MIHELNGKALAAGDSRRKKPAASALPLTQLQAVILIDGRAACSPASGSRRRGEISNRLREHKLAIRAVEFDDLLFDEPNRPMTIASEATAAIESLADQNRFTTVV